MPSQAGPSQATQARPSQARQSQPSQPRANPTQPSQHTKPKPTQPKPEINIKYFSSYGIQIRILTPCLDQFPHTLFTQLLQNKMGKSRHLQNPRSRKWEKQASGAILQNKMGKSWEKTKIYKIKWEKLRKKQRSTK